MRTLRLVDDWFGPTTCHFLVLDRSILSAMPKLWQQRFVKIMEELEDATQSVELPTTYEIKARNDRGKQCGPPPRESLIVDVNPTIQRERAVEFIQALMLQYGISLTELDVTGA